MSTDQYLYDDVDLTAGVPDLLDDAVDRELGKIVNVVSFDNGTEYRETIYTPGEQFPDFGNAALQMAFRAGYEYANRRADARAGRAGL